jgi:hypothetical protein
VGKLVAAFVFFLAASALAIREAKPPAPPIDADVATPSPPAAHVDEPPPSRAIRDEVPPWVKYAAPTVTPPPPPPQRVITIESSIITFDNGDSADDVPDVIDKCPDQPSDSDDNDGCPEPANAIEDRVILVD